LVIPDIEWTPAYATALVAILGTTISPYLFFWQAAQEIEEQHRHHSKPLYETPAKAGPELQRIRIDTLTGMAFSSIIAIAIVYAAAATLHANGIHNIETSAQAAEALRPIAGDLAFALFALGIIAITEMLGRTGSLAARPLKAKFFYGAIGATTLAGGLINFAGLDPARALYWAAVVNGVLAAPLMAVMMLIVRNKAAMGDLVLPQRATWLGWAATAVMAAATAIFFWFLAFPG
jgi:Mn2+/Fe2+ NRAMP family transporter